MGLAGKQASVRVAGRPQLAVESVSLWLYDPTGWGTVLDMPRLSTWVHLFGGPGAAGICLSLPLLPQSQTLLAPVVLGRGWAGLSVCERQPWHLPNPFLSGSMGPLCPLTT